jgi:microcystin-dependent protein
MQLSMGKVVALVLAVLTAVPQSRPAAAEPFLAEISTVAFDYCPRGWAQLRGQLLPINQNQALFSLLGTEYGGNGQTNFALPYGKPVFTLDRKPMLQCIALQGIFPSRE